MQLTPQAELLVAHARAVLDRLEEAESEVARSLTTVGGTVRIAVFQSAAHAMVPQALTLLRGEHPDLRVEVTEREPERRACSRSSARDFDLVIAEQYPGHTRAHRDDLDRVPSPPTPSGSRCRRIPPASSADARASTPSRSASPRPPPCRGCSSREGTASREWAEQLCRDAGFEPDVRFETADLMAHIRLIRSGNAVGPAARPRVGRRDAERDARRPAGASGARGLHLDPPRRGRPAGRRRVPRRARAGRTGHRDTRRSVRTPE